ncbi:glycosyl hydrolase [Cardiobacterium valvarum]|uniref:glycosyl hydrolase n=1 Tax=Cardiobacterium valvarum TaxID=194702 RepID=UPI0035F0B748
MTATVTDDDGIPNNVQYQWLRDGQPIGGQTGATYRLTTDDAGHKIAVRATYKDNAGYHENPLSEATATVADNPQPQPNNAGTVSITGEAKVGSELTANISDADGVPDTGVTYQWQRDGQPISQATGKTYTLTQDDAGHKISVRATYKDNAGHDESPLSEAQTIVPQDAGHLTVKETDGPIAGTMHIGSLADGEAVTIGNTTLNLARLGNLAQQPQTVLDNDKGTLTLTGYDRASGTLHYTYDPKEQPGFDNVREIIDVAIGREGFRGTNGIGVQPLNPAWGANLAAAEESYARAAKLGVKWVRIVASWHRAQAAENGDYNWEDLDAAVKLAQKYGMKVLMQVSGTPEWASGADQLSAAEKEALDKRGYWVSNFAPKPEHDADYAKFMAAVVKRYAPQGIKDYEVWNEPGNPGFWHDSPGNLKPNAAHYTNLLKLAYKAAHDAAPDVNVLAGGMTVGETRSSDGYIDPRDFLEQMYAAGAKGHFDTLSHHPYGITSREFKSNGWALMNGDVVAPPPGEKTLKQIMQEHGDGDKKIWATEVGREAMYQGLDETQQATVIKTLLEQHAKTGEGPMILYQAQNDRAPYVPGIVSRDADGDGKPDVNIDTDGDGKPDANLDADGNGIPDALDKANRENYFGLWTHDGKEKPAVGVIRSAAGQTGGTKHSTLTVDILDNGANPPPVNHAPTDISLSTNKIAEGKDGAVVGRLTTTDPDVGDKHTYTVSDGRFEVTADGTLKLKAGYHIDYATEKTVDLTITSTDSGGLSVRKRIYVFVQDDPDYPAPSPQPNQQGTVSISGEAKPGSTLTATVKDGDGFAADNVQYQWLRDGNPIANANGKTYTLTSDDAGHKITVRATYKDNAGYDEKPLSSPLDIAANPPPADVPGVTLRGPGEISEGGKATYTVDLDLAPLPRAHSAAELLDTLRQNAGRGILFGQHQGLSAGRSAADGQGYTSDIHALTGRYPSIVGLAMMEPPMDRSKTVAENGKAMGAAIAKIDALGGIAAVSAHWDNPMPGPNGANDFSQVNLKRLLPGGDLNGTLNEWLDTIVAMAQHAVRADGSKIPFIFRPLHEGNGEWAWWYYERGGVETYKELFRYIVNYVKEHGADGQILTAFAPNGNFNGDESRYRLLYPGDDVVDILGYDGYDTNAAKLAKDGWVKEVVEDMAMLARMAEARGKVAALTEFGRGGDKMIKPQGNVDPEFYTDLLKGILADPDARKIAYMMTWANWGDNDIYVPKAGEELAENFKAFAKQLLLTRVADRDISVDVTVEHGTTDDGDLTLSTHRVTIRKGESSATFTVDVAADGKAEGDETYTVKIRNPQGATITAGKDSVATTVHDETTPPTNHEGKITLSGEAKVGSELTATISDSDGFAADNVQYQWLRDGNPIAKANGKTYTLTSDDAGHKITVRATYKDNAGYDEKPLSSPLDIDSGTPNHSPTAITLNAGDSASYWVKAESGGATVGKLGVSDPDSGDTHSYTVSDSRFEITADGTLKLKDGQSVHYGEEKRIQLTVTATDNHGAAYSRDIAVQVKDEGNKGAASPLPAAPRA